MRDKSKAKIRNYQINFAASLQIPSPNRKITDRNRPSNSPPPRSLRNNRHIVPYRPILSYPILSYPILSCPVPSRPVLSCPVHSRPVLSCRPLRPVPDQTVFASEATTTHTPIRPARIQPSAPRGPFPKSNPVPASAPVGTASSRPASPPYETRSATPHHAPRQVHRPHTTKYPRRKFRQGYPLYPKIVTWQRIHIKMSPHQYCREASGLAR